MNKTNRQWRLATYPDGMPTEDNWIMSESPVPEPEENEVVARAIYLDSLPAFYRALHPVNSWMASRIGFEQTSVASHRCTQPRTHTRTLNSQRV